tara:strand:- start:85 stop:273 length:189 start_codon:yes stop_codon:yes gene_type:complete
MKDVDIKMANLEEEVVRLVRRNTKLEGTLGRLRANLMTLEFPREHQETVDKFFQAVERSFTG